MIMSATLMGGGLPGRCWPRIFLESQLVYALAVPVEHRFVLSGQLGGQAGIAARSWAVDARTQGAVFPVERDHGWPLMVGMLASPTLQGGRNATWWQDN
jgi:hypothetical protein